MYRYVIVNYPPTSSCTSKIVFLCAVIVHYVLLTSPLTLETRVDSVPHFNDVTSLDGPANREETTNFQHYHLLNKYLLTLAYYDQQVTENI